MSTANFLYEDIFDTKQLSIGDMIGNYSDAEHLVFSITSNTILTSYSVSNYHYVKSIEGIKYV